MDGFLVAVTLLIFLLVGLKAPSWHIKNCIECQKIIKDFEEHRRYILNGGYCA